MRQAQVGAALLLAALSTAGAQAWASTACPTAAEMNHQHLYGVWRAEFEDGSTADLRFEKHATFAQSVSGEVVRAGARAQVAGDVDEGVFSLEESADGKAISATWAGQVVDSSCGKEIKGTWNNERTGTRRTFVLRKPRGWQ